MAHPQMFDDDDPVLARVRELALALPGADVKVSHGRPAFFTKKVFAYYGGSRKVDDGYVEHPTSIIVVPDPDDLVALREHPQVWVPMYLGVSGWIGFDITDDTDWDEVAELLDASYRATATKTLVRELDSRS